MKNNKGMTLVELIVVVGFIGIIALLSGTFLLYGSRNFHKQTDKTDTLATARYSMDYINREIRKADNVEANQEENTLIIDEKIIRLDNTTLFKGDEKIATGIHGLSIIEDENKIEIIITIIGRDSKEEKLSSTIYIRR